MSNFTLKSNSNKYLSKMSMPKSKLKANSWKTLPNYENDFGKEYFLLGTGNKEKTVPISKLQLAPTGNESLDLR
jgi:hypothetical protein